ncbi:MULTISPECIES: hypothetical protein [Paraburkholderia]|uniref:hypothetical protein n=1 Tax=Paraburkholderia TaxID=1822464 RepID=UPI0003790EC8|nr:MULTISPECIES: hypothetical protein [Paraburkholderia]MDH6147670.1 hypothetical protein [Paraburkholderia sp. WSM4179]
MPTFNPAHKTELDALLSRVSHVRAGKMFVVVKLQKASTEKLLNADRNAGSFQTMRRPKMRECVQLNVSKLENYRVYRPVFEESIRYVLAQQGGATS